MPVTLSPSVYLDTSLRTFQRVMTALSKEEDPYEAAMNFEKDPIGVFFNDKAKVFGYDYYKRQNSAKSELTAAMVDAWRTLQRNDNPQAEYIFKVQDSDGNLCACAMRKTQDGGIEWGKLADDSGVVAFNSGDILGNVNGVRAQVITSVIGVAVNLIKDLFAHQKTSFNDEKPPIELAENKSFQMKIAQEVVADANENDLRIFSGAINYIVANDALLDTATLKNIIENSDKYGKGIIQQCILAILNNADKYEKDLIQQYLLAVLKKPTSFDRNVVKSLLKHVVTNADRYDEESVRECALLLVNNTHGFWDSLTVRMASQAISQVILNPGEYELGLVQRCASSITNNPKLWSGLMVQAAAQLIASAFANRAKCGEKFVIECASTIVNNPKFWDKETVRQAWKVVLPHLKSLSSQTLGSMARMIIHANSSFFYARVRNREGFESFYSGKEDRLKAITDYSKGLESALTSTRQKISILWTDATPQSPSMRHFIKGDIKHDKSLTEWDASWTERKEKIVGSKNRANDSPSLQIVGLYSLWLSGECKGAVSVNRRVALYVIENRKHQALKFWAERPTEEIMPHGQVVNAGGG